MKYNPAIHKRKSIRLKGYDYSQAGLYFITICIQNREMLLGRIENDEMILNDAGKMVESEWQKLPERFSNVELHEFAVMPNHFHAILEIVGATLVVAQNDGANQKDATSQNDGANQNDNIPENDAASTSGANDPASQSGATTRVAPTDNADIADDIENPDKTLGNMIAAFKSITTVEYIKRVKKSGWQPFKGKLWQRNYYEHIIRDERAYQNISEYIINNPARWRGDKFYRI